MPELVSAMPRSFRDLSLLCKSDVLSLLHTQNRIRIRIRVRVRKHTWKPQHHSRNKRTQSHQPLPLHTFTDRKPTERFCSFLCVTLAVETYKIFTVCFACACFYIRFAILCLAARRYCEYIIFSLRAFFAALCSCETRETARFFCFYKCVLCNKQRTLKYYATKIESNNWEFSEESTLKIFLLITINPTAHWKFSKENYW